MENVPQLASKNVFSDFMTILKNNSYKYIDYRIIRCEDYGTPQTRRRLVLLASKIAPINIISPKEFGGIHHTVRDAIGNLPPIDAGETLAQDDLHRSCSLSSINLKRIIASKPGGSWHDWPCDLITTCHKKTSGQSYKNVYGRMQWDSLSPTITTQFYGYGTGRFGHPDQNRAISLREGAILQGFPSNYLFFPKGDKMATNIIGRMIGNAVPVQIGKLIGTSILKSITD